MCPGLEKYVRRYYDDWLRCSRRWCSMLGIPQEAYDLFADALLGLCEKSDAQLQDLIEHEEAGERKLFFYVRRIIQCIVYEYRRYKVRSFAPIEELCTLRHEFEGNAVPDEIFDAFRDKTAKLRADDFVELDYRYTEHGRIYRYVTIQRSAYGVKSVVRYEAIPSNGKRRQFGNRSDAVVFLAGQIPPPPKNRRAVHVKLRLLQINIA